MNRRKFLTGVMAAYAGTAVAAAPKKNMNSSALPLFPPAAGKPGAPFDNPNLKLVVLDALLKAKRIDLGQPADLAKFVFGREVDLETEGWNFSPQLYDYLVRYPLPQALISSVQELGFDGGNQIYRYAWYHWDGESNEFDVKSLAGIEKCVNLEVFIEISMLGKCDLNLLLPLQKLSAIELGPGRHPNAAALLELPNLRNLGCFSDSLADPGVLKALSAKGVTVKVYS